jgi:ribonuclease HI
MEHILTQCQESGQKEVWDIASELWQMKTGKDLHPTIGQIMAGGIMKQDNLGETRVHKILITESAHLVWRLRNEHVIQGSGSKSLVEIRNRWLKTINNRLDINCAMTNALKYEKALKVLLVKATWMKTLKIGSKLACR